MSEESIDIEALDGFIPLSVCTLGTHLEKPYGGVYGFMQYEENSIKGQIAWWLLGLAMRLGRFEVYIGRK